MAEKRGTETSRFGSKGRRGHDASYFYASRMYRDGSDDDNSQPTVEKPIPLQTLDQIITGSSEQMDGLPDASVHLMVTSPPYNARKEYDEDLTLDEYLDLLRAVFRETYRVLVPGGRACINIANLGRKPYIPLSAFITEVMLTEGFLMRGEVIWDKGSSAGSSTAWGSWRSASNPTLRDVHEYILVFCKGRFKRDAQGRGSTIERDQFLEWSKSVWSFPTESATRVGHPAPFPVELPQRLIQLYTFQGDVVLDPFIGSGTTAIAALAAGRHFVGYEIEAGYAETARRRIEKYRAEQHSPTAHVDVNKHSTVARTLKPHEIIQQNEEILDAGLTDDALEAFFQRIFQQIIDARNLYPFWVCIDCKHGDYGMKPNGCPYCRGSHVFEVATFQSRGTATGEVFQEAVRHILNRFFPHLGVTSSHGTPYQDYCDLYLPDVLGIEIKGSPTRIKAPDGQDIVLSRPGMRRTDTEKKANSNAATFKEDHRRNHLDVRFYVLTNAVPDGWHEEHHNIDAIYDVTRASQWSEFVSDIDVDTRRAARSRMGRR